jgi:hypothetical protein
MYICTYLEGGFQIKTTKVAHGIFFCKCIFEVLSVIYFLLLWLFVTDLGLTVIKYFLFGRFSLFLLKDKLEHSVPSGTQCESNNRSRDTCGYRPKVVVVGRYPVVWLFKGQSTQQLSHNKIN